MERERGEICRWDAVRGFGFANSRAGGPNIFIHIRNFSERVGSNDVREGMQITFTRNPTPAHKDGTADIKIISQG